MRLVYIDIDTLRADHLGCYGYERPTTPNIDALAREGVRFERVYASDTPCLPSRSALFSGRFGIKSGVVNHGGTRADPFPGGPERGRRSNWANISWPNLLRQAGLWCATISTFAERHSAFHWYAGFNEVLNLGTDGLETADQVSRAALDWLRRRGQDDNWFLHLHLWDPHTPYRTPASFGDPFAATTFPSWIDAEVLRDHRLRAGPHSAQEVLGFEHDARFDGYERQPQTIASLGDIRAVFDGYDAGVRYADEHVGHILECLKQLHVWDETAVLVSSDHGETLGEFGIYCDHQTADEHTHRVPAVMRWPGMEGGVVDRQLRYQVDIAATVVELVGVTPPPEWDGKSFASDLVRATAEGRDYLILSCAAWSVQRSVRFDDWICIRTYHDAFHGFPAVMLFDLASDAHEQVDLSADRPDVVGRAATFLLDWETEAMRTADAGVDPLWTVLAEGGGWYTRGHLERYLTRLRATGRGRLATEIAAANGVG